MKMYSHKLATRDGASLLRKGDLKLPTKELFTKKFQKIIQDKGYLCSNWGLVSSDGGCSSSLAPPMWAIRIRAGSKGGRKGHTPPILVEKQYN